MITQTGSKLLIELDDNVAVEMAEVMAAGLRALPDDGMFASPWTAPHCLAGCSLHLDAETNKYSHAPDCPVPLALAVARLCPEVLSNLKLIDECLGTVRQSAETLSLEGNTMNEEPVKSEEPAVTQFESNLPLCPYCKDRGRRSVLKPEGNKLECPDCGNVFWANDPAGASSRNEVPQ